MNALTKGQNKDELIKMSRNLDKTGTVLQSAAHVCQKYLLCDIQSSCASRFTGELCSTRVSIKSLPHYTFLENILVGGKGQK